MGWEKRGRYLYYLVRRKVAGRVQTTFMGRGPEAEVAASLDLLRRQQREEDRRRRRAEQAQWEDADDALARVIAATRLLVRATLRGAGYHQHQRGAWRRRRGRREETMSTHQSTMEQLTAEEQERLYALLEKAQKGDSSVVEELKVVLDRHPSIWQRCGDLAGQALAAWMNLAAGENLLAKESLQRKVEAMRSELGGPAPSPLEKLLVERIVISWLQVGQADLAVAQARINNLDVHRLLLQRQGCAQRRLLQAIKELATLRKLTRPALSPLDIASRAVAEAPVLVPFSRGSKERRLAAVEN
jgi:hypothetical protein